MSAKEHDGTRRAPVKDPQDDLRPRYGAEFFNTMKPNRFAGTELTFKGRRAVYLDADVAEVFDTSEAVNTVLRATIRAMRRAAPPRSRKSAKRRTS